VGCVHGGVSACGGVEGGRVWNEAASDHRRSRRDKESRRNVSSAAEKERTAAGERAPFAAGYLAAPGRGRPFPFYGVLRTPPIVFCSNVLFRLCLFL